MFVDRKNSIEIVARELSTNTNFAGEVLNSEEELSVFANRIGFPSHGIILRECADGFQSVHKGIRQWDELLETFRNLMKRFGSVYAETDMRAMHNPTRMTIIELATHKLVNKVLSVCPSCAWPGFDVTDVNAGLPCDTCGAPTQSTKSLIYTCTACGFCREQLNPKGKETEEARFCDFCNP